MLTQQSYPDFLQTYASLKTHFDEQYEGLGNTEKGDRFSEFVCVISQYTNTGRRFDKPEIGLRSHDGGIDLKSINENEILLVQAKYSLKDKADFGTIISKFQDYFEKNYSESVGPLFAHTGIQVGESQRVYFQIVTLHDLSRIVKSYEESQLSSISFYQQLKSTNQIEIIDGNSILHLLRTAYRKTHFLPSNFEMEFTTEPIQWNGVFLGVISSNHLKKVYEEYGDALFFENLRDFLSSTEVDQEIVKTVRDEPTQLLARNNGLVLKASKIEKIKGKPIVKLVEGSVVNGCQTTLSVVLNAKEECHVLVKIVETSQENAWEITRSANFQNQVKRFDLELAQFLRPQIIKKAATQSGFGVKGNLSASSIIDAINSEEITYEELRALFIGIFSQRPSNIFDTEYNQLSTGVIDLFFKDDPNGIKLFDQLFTIFRASRKITEQITSKLRKRNNEITHDTYRRFFQEGKYAYRAFFTLLAASASSGIDISTSTTTDQQRHELMFNFLNQTINLIENDINKFNQYYKFTVQAVAGSVKGQNKGEIQQYLWKHMRHTEFSVFLERIHQVADLASSLDEDDI